MAVKLMLAGFLLAFVREKCISSSLMYQPDNPHILDFRVHLRR
jgi:hypothetical protein